MRQVGFLWVVAGVMSCAEPSAALLCGNGVVDSGEACDDVRSQMTAAATPVSCPPAVTVWSKRRGLRRRQRRRDRRA